MKTINLDKVKWQADPQDRLLLNPGEVHATGNVGKKDLIIGIFRIYDPGDSDMFFDR